MGGASSRNKGAEGERELARLLTGLAAKHGFPLTLDRNLEQVRYGGADVNGVPGLEVEVKRQEQLGVAAWWKQVCNAAAKTGKRPLLAWRQNRKPWSFRVLTWVWPAQRPLYVDMDLHEFEAWFADYLRTMGDGS